MSIVITIQRLVADRKLIPYQPIVRRSAHPHGGRFLWLTPDTHAWCLLSGDHPDPRVTDESIAHLGDQLNAFVWGEFMDYDGVDMRRLCPQEKDIWEIKSHLKKPQLRVFGWFVLPKWFVATHRAVRGDLEETRGPKWHAIISKAEHARTTLVGSVDFYHDDPGEYVRNPT